MKWILFAMVLSAGGEPVDKVDPTLAEFQYDSINVCSERLVVERAEIITNAKRWWRTHQSYNERYLICDWVRADEVLAARAFHAKQFRDAFAPF